MSAAPFGVRAYSTDGGTFGRPAAARGYSTVRAQMQAGRLNDLLGAGYSGKARYVLYHPGFTRSGDRTPLGPLARAALGVLSRLAARPVAESAAPIVALLDDPPAAQLTALDRGKELPLSLPTLAPAAAARLRSVVQGEAFA
ncbi:hypothetical protein ACPPVO_57660 [Dactylosporangium sp. McL0621]|uniref:hypothetical protein n=1 Tax=Dactylosporangium sp. McL0621 TaxID=3415678 RepID=UPI003CF34A80